MLLSQFATAHTPKEIQKRLYCSVEDLFFLQRPDLVSLESGSNCDFERDPSSLITWLNESLCASVNEQFHVLQPIQSLSSVLE